MNRYIAVIFLLLPFYIGAQENKSFEYYVDSLFTDLEVDTTSYMHHAFLSVNTEDWMSEKKLLKDSLCSHEVIIYPKITMTIDERELVQVLESGETENEFLFLEDNDIKGALYRVWGDSSKLPAKLEKIGTDINVNFGSILSKGYYKESLLRFLINFECVRFSNTKSARFFYYDGKKLVKEILVTEKAGEVSLRKMEYLDNG